MHVARFNFPSWNYFTLVAESDTGCIVHSELEVLEVAYFRIKLFLNPQIIASIRNPNFRDVMV